MGLNKRVSDPYNPIPELPDAYTHTLTTSDHVGTHSSDDHVYADCPYNCDSEVLQTLYQSSTNQCALEPAPISGWFMLDYLYL